MDAHSAELVAKWLKLTPETAIKLVEVAVAGGYEAEDVIAIFKELRTRKQRPDGSVRLDHRSVAKIAHSVPMTVRELAVWMGVTPVTAQRYIDQAVQAGLVERGDDVSAGRGPKAKTYVAKVTGDALLERTIRLELDAKHVPVSVFDRVRDPVRVQAAMTQEAKRQDEASTASDELL